ncbi:MAG: glycosyltransferase family 61 protein [Balneolaceae bacterium]|nr:glycosyltransferase family 61 protein [Balneolaceae bacterium]
MRLLRHIWQVTFGKIFWFFYAPKNIVDKNFTRKLTTEIQKINNYRYKTIRVKNCTTFTNRIDNISFSVHKKLIPEISWQFENGKILNDDLNKLLTGEIQPKSPPKKINGTVLSLLTGGGGNYNYYHWLYDSLPRLKLFDRYLDNHQDIKFLVPDNKLHFQKETLEYLGISTEQQLSSKKYHHIKSDLLLATSHPNPDPDKIPRWITNFLRNKFLHLAETTNQSPYIYISRNDHTNNRQLINENELLDLLNNYGFQSYTLSNLSFKDQVTLFKNARIIIGVHGAGLTNLTFCNSDTSVIELFPGSYQPKMYQSISKNLNLNYRSFTCTVSEHTAKDIKSASLVLNNEHLKNIEKVLLHLI